MTNFRIIFTESNVSLPDGACVGIMGEHNAVQLAITLPESMVTGMSFHTVTVNGVESALILSGHTNADGAYQTENTLYFPLTAAHTDKPYMEVFVTAYKQTGDAVQVIDKTVSARGLRLLPAAKGSGAVGGLAAEIYQIRQQLMKFLGALPGVTITEINGGNRVTITDYDHPEGQSFDVLNGTGAGGHEHKNQAALDAVTEEMVNNSHYHGNKGSLDKIVVTSSLADYSESVGYNLKEGTVAFVTDIESIKATLRLYDNKYPHNGFVHFRDTLEYSRFISAATYPYTLLVHTALQRGSSFDYFNVTVGLVPVKTSAAELGSDMIGMYFMTDQHETNYLMCAVCDGFVNETVLDEYSNGNQIDVAMLMYAYEDLSGYWQSTDGNILSETCNLTSGWNLLLAERDANNRLVGIRVVSVDPNTLFELGNYSSCVWNVSGISSDMLLDVFYYDRYQDLRGVWIVRDGTFECIAEYYNDRITILENAVKKLREPANKTTLDKFSEQNGNPMFNGQPFSAYVESFVKDYTHKLHNTFRIRDDRLQVDTSTGLAYIGEDGHLYVDTDAAGNITENNRLEVMV